MAAPATQAPQAIPTDNDMSSQASKAAEEDKELAFGEVWEGANSQISRPERPALDGRRRTSSVAFHTAPAEETIEKESTTKPLPPTNVSRRMSSPPPAPTYYKGISFDTFDNKDASTESFTLQYKHGDYRHNTRSRTFLCGTDAKDYSEYALEWMIEELVDDGDDIICLRVVDKESKLANETSMETGKYKEEAQMLLDSVVKKNAIEQKAINVVLELAVGRVEKVIQKMIQLYEPAALIVGTRGRNLGGMQGLLPGSVSKYCLQHSPVPVIVVRPTSKRIKKKQKRLQETGRSLYSTMLEQSKTSGRLSLYDKSALDSSTVSPTATKQESEAVAKAIGPPRGILRNPQRGVYASASNPTSDADEPPPVPSFSLPIGFLSTTAAPRADLAMKSPIIAALGESWDDSPATSGPPSRARSRSPAPSTATAATVDPTSIAGGDTDPQSTASATDNPVFSDTDEDLLGIPKIVEHRRPSTRQTTPWLNSILRQPEKRPVSKTRQPARSRSR